METKKLIDEAIALPVEERANLIDSLLKSLNPEKLEVERKWVAIAKKRLEEIQSGKVKAIPGEEVFDRIWKRFEE